MKIALGSDHGGYPMKEHVKAWLESHGYEVEDKGCFGLESVDWTGRFFSFYEEQQKKQAEERICPADIRAQSEAWPCPAPLSDICGSYTEGGYGDILITREGDGLKLDLGTLSLHGFHYRDRYFLFSEEHVLPGLQLEAEAETDRDGNVTAFLVALEPTDKKKIRFVKI